MQHTRVPSRYISLEVHVSVVTGQVISLGWCVLAESCRQPPDRSCSSTPSPASSSRPFRAGPMNASWLWVWALGRLIYTQRTPEFGSLLAKLPLRYRSAAMLGAVPASSAAGLSGTLLPAARSCPRREQSEDGGARSGSGCRRCCRSWGGRTRRRSPGVPGRRGAGGAGPEPRRLRGAAHLHSASPPLDGV